MHRAIEGDSTTSRFGTRLALSWRVTSSERDDIEDRLGRNLARVDNLVVIYEQRNGARAGRPSVGDADLLRAAVVLLHSTLEDVLRSVLEVRWPCSNDPELFRRVAFVLPGDHRRPEKLSVGELAQHLRGKTIDEVVRDAVHGHLEHASFNSIDDVVVALDRAGIATELVAAHAREVYGLMQRRHLVVHRADRNDRSGSGHHSARPIRVANVRDWKAHVEPLCRAILARI